MAFRSTRRDRPETSAAFATDLFQGASVHAGATLGGLGGSVNFSTLQPTLSWISQIQISTGSYGRYNYSIAETGSAGKLGLAVQTVNRLYPSLVDGDLYTDASGLDYVHDGDSTISGNILSARYEFGDDNSLSGMFMNSTRNTNVVCLRYNGDPATTLPCGYGPNNTDDSNVQLYSLSDNALIGATQLQTSLFSLDSGSVLNELARYVNGDAGADGLLERPRGRPDTFSTRRFRRNSATRSRFRPMERRRSSRRRRWSRRPWSSTTAPKRRSTTLYRRPTRFTRAIS